MNQFEELMKANGLIEKLYKNRVNLLIRQKYDLSDEIALHRQQQEKPEEYAAYYAYCEECKRQAKLEIYGEE